MNYELALKLKEAGFRPIEHADRAPEQREYLQKIGGKGHLDSVYSPTLEELIEACGEDFYGLEILDKKWRAISLQQNIETFGLTPSEAVANLWLELNK